ncbi:MAG: TPM domain-containing protein [Aeromonadaceae bacterium]
MGLINDKFADALASQIQAVEQQTAAEIVTVLARRSDDYLYIPTLWAAFIAMLTPFVVHELGFWLEWQELFLYQWLVWLFATLLFRWPPLMMRLIPSSVRRHRAAQMARQQFLEQGLHRTADRLGVLIFVSEAEHYVEIVVDQGVADQIADTHWQQIVSEFTQSVKSGAIEEGFTQCVAQVGAQLIRQFPATSPQNELSNRLIYLN